MDEPIRHDWPKIIIEIEFSGVSLYKLAQMLDRQVVQVKRWRNGAEPRHSEGEKLLAIHRDVVTSVTVPNSNPEKSGA